MGAPRNILLATDLGSHSDRALDRAAQLARQWRATLHVVHVMRAETADALWPSAMQAWKLSAAGSSVIGDAHIAAVRRQVEHDLREPIDSLRIHVVAGKPASAILETAKRENCELVVIGSGGPPFAGTHFNTTGAELLELASQSVLVVKSRPHGAYARVLVGTDFTAESRHGLEIGLDWFCSATFTLVHALNMPYRSLLMDAGHEHEFAGLEHETMRAFIDGMQLPDAVRQRLHTHVEHGLPEITLREYSIANKVDLTVIGALKRKLAFRMLVGSSASRIAQTVPGDILMVRATTNDGSARDSRPSS